MAADGVSQPLHPILFAIHTKPVNGPPARFDVHSQAEQIVPRAWRSHCEKNPRARLATSRSWSYSSPSKLCSSSSFFFLVLVVDNFDAWRLILDNAAAHGAVNGQNARPRRRPAAQE